MSPLSFLALREPSLNQNNPAWQAHGKFSALVRIGRETRNCFLVSLSSCLTFRGGVVSVKGAASFWREGERAVNGGQ